MADITLTKFCGATVERFTAVAGWNEQATTVTVGLVEDARGGDRYRPPVVGQPAAFSMGGLAFEGLVQHQQVTSEVNGVRHEVVLTDPREVLDGVRVIVDSLTTPPPVPNVLNAYGYWEDKLGFGGSMSNASGMLWQAPFDVLNLDTKGFSITEVGTVGIKPAVEAMTSGGGGRFGGPILFRGQSYSLDLSGLPTPPSYYRIGGTYPTLLELVNQLCQDAGCDYLVSLEGGVIKVKTVSRVRQPQPGQVAAYAAGVKDAVVRQYGVELRNDYTNAMLIGGSVQELVMVQYDGSQSIWPYWGKDVDGNVIVGTGNPLTGEHEALLNASPIADVIGSPQYHVTMPELRCAASESGFESWAYYVMKYEPDKADAIGLVNSIDSQSDLAELFPDVMLRRDLVAVDEDDLRQFGLMNESDYWTTRANRVFDFVRQAATEYFGVRFLVRIPFFVYWKVTPETLQVVTSDEIGDGGYLPENAQPLGLGYLDIDKFLTEDGRFECFVQFPLDKAMDLSGLDQSSAAVSNGSLYVKATVDRDAGIVYPQGSIYPYVVVTLDQAVYRHAPDPLGGVADIAAVMGMDESSLYAAVAVRHGSFPIRLGPSPYLPNAAAVPMKSNRLTYGPWGTFPSGGGRSGVPGKTLVDHDDEMTPWNYGGYDTLNLAASARLAGAATDMQESETASVEFPGLPAHGIGDSLIAGGPNVTSIDCSVSTGGVTTRYTMRTYTPQFGAFQRANADRLRRLGVAALQMRRRVRAAFQRASAAQQVRNAAAFGAALNTAHAVAQSTPLDTVYGTMTFSKKYGYRTQVSHATVDEFMANVRGDNDKIYWATGGMSLEGLYRPFSTAYDRVDSGDMPHFEQIADLVDNTDEDNVPVNDENPVLSAKTLDPLNNSDIDILVSGKSYKDVGTLHRLKPRPKKKGQGVKDTPAPTLPGDTGSKVKPGGDVSGGFSGTPGSEVQVAADTGLDYTTARGVGLRGPVVIVGWGAEYTGKPLPNSGDETQTVDQWENEWLEDPAKHPEEWRAGPALLHWDNWRKGWTVPTILVGTLDTDVGGSGGMMSIQVDGVDLGDKVKVYSRLGTVTSGSLAVAAYYPLENKWHVVAAQCSGG